MGGGVSLSSEKLDGNPGAAAELPLAGIRVIDAATFIAAPFAASMLAEFGAEVIKVEMPGSGDPLRVFGTTDGPGGSLVWKSEARNKRSVTINLKHKDGVGLFRRLVATADVLCENFRPGTLEDWGLGPDVLAADNPRLVLLRISAYGQTGPYRDRPGFARIAHAFGGLTHLAGLPDGPPVTPGSTSLADYTAGLYGALGVMMALRAREQSGRGQIVELGLYEAIFRLLDELAPAYDRHGAVRGREGLSTANACPHGHFRCKDGAWVAIACTSDRMFARLAAVMGRPELAAPDRFATTAQRLVGRSEVEALVNAFASAHDRGALIDLCVAGEVPIGPVNDIADLFADPQVAARGNLVRLPDGMGGALAVPAVVPRLSATPGRVASLGPALGADTADILGQLLGLSAAEIDALSRSGAI